MSQIAHSPEYCIKFPDDLTDCYPKLVVIHSNV